MTKKQQAEPAEKILFPFTYEELDGKTMVMPLNNYQHLCLALEIIERRLACDEPGCIDTSKDPELGEVHQALSVAVICHPHWQNPFDLCHHIQAAVSSRFLTYGNRVVA